MALFALCITVLMVSCTRPRGSASACFNMSKTPAKVNDTLYLLNCSLNYDRFKWTVPSYLIIDSVNKHMKFVPTAAGNVDISLLVFDADSSSASTITKTVQVQ
jgi:hypothetical protein